MRNILKTNRSIIISVSAIVSLLLIGISTHAGFAASFSCDQATTSIEKIICSDPELSQLDEKLDATYREALEKVPLKSESLREGQRQWLRDRRNKCKDAHCMADAYKKRIKELNKTISQGAENIIPTGIPKKYRDIAKNSNSNVCGFILTLANENLVDEFIEENLKAAKISNLKKITFQNNSDNLEKGEAFRFFINTEDPSTEFIWVRKFAGSLNCQHDSYFKINKEGKYDYSEKLNKLIPLCSEGDCCAGAGHALFQFGGKLYSYAYHYDDSNNFKINEITNNGNMKVCEFNISYSKIKNMQLLCADDKICKEIKDYITINLNTLIDDDMSVNNCDFTDFGKNIDLGADIDKENIGCCNNIDFNNDGLKDLACMRNFPTRFSGKVLLFQKEKGGKYHEIITQWKNSFLKQHWHDGFGYNIDLLFIKIGGNIYTIDYSFDRKKTPPIGTFEIYLVQDDLVNKIGKIIIELDRNVKLIKLKN